MKQKADKPAIRSIAPWFGGKRTLAGRIVRELGPHRMYFEPFCGSMAVLMAKPVVGHETVNDLHADLINLAMVLASPRWGDLYDRLDRTLYHEDLFRLYKHTFMAREAPPPEDPGSVTDAHIERAYCYFIVSWMGRNGVSGTERVNYCMAIRWTPGGGGGGKRFRSATDSIAEWHRRLQNVVILRRDAFEIIPNIDDHPGCAIYVDPPYFSSGRSNGGGSRYLHNFDEAEHARLAEALGRFQKARIVVSYYEDPRVDGLYRPPKWTKRKVYGCKNLHVQNRRGAKRQVAPEVLLMNGPSYIKAKAKDSLFG